MRLLRTVGVLVGLGWLVAGVVTGQAPEIPFVHSLESPVLGDAFRQPRAVHVDSHTGEVFVCDSLNHRIMIFDQEGFFRFQIVGGQQFRAPVDIAVDETGYLFVLATSGGSKSVHLMDFDGLLLQRIELAGLPESAVEPDISSLAYSALSKRLYLVDSANHCLWIVGRDGAVVSHVDLTVDVPEDEIEEIRLGRVDVYGETVLIADPMLGRIWLLSLDGKVFGKIGTRGTAACQLAFPTAAAIDTEGKILVLDKQRALYMRWDPASGKCLQEYSRFGSAPGALYQPDDLSLDAFARLYVSQGFEGRVQVFEAPAPAAHSVVDTK